MTRVISLITVAVLLAGCGMNRAVGVLPNTLDDLGKRSQAWRSEDATKVAPKP